MTKPDVKLCSAFNKETRDGLRMGKYSELLGKAIESIVTKKEESDIDSFLDGYVGELFEERITGLDDFELICFLVIKAANKREQSELAQRLPSESRLSK